MRMFFRHWWLALAMALAGMAVAGQAGARSCTDRVDETAPDSRYIVHGDGTVTDRETGLMWRQCSEGQTWSNGACVGAASEFSWQGSLQRAADVNTGAAGERHGYSDWRLPNRNELASLVERQCYSPAINLSVFPNTAPLNYWWSSSTILGTDGVFVVYFKYGGVNFDNKYRGYYVRFVRGEQSLGPLPPDCAGTHGGTATLDNCGVCDTNPANDCTQDCTGNWGGTATLDNCGVCDTDPANDCQQDCAGNWGGTATADLCGVCLPVNDPARNTSCADCAGVPNGTSTLDNCGVCDTNPANDCQQDCAGTWGGTATRNNCGGVCDSDPSNDDDCYRPAVGGGPYVVDDFGTPDIIDDTVLDQATGLEWQRADNGATYTWEEAIDYCESLDLGGYTDWRLPNIWELRTIVDDSRFNPAIDPVVFPIQAIPPTYAGGVWWSSTTATNDANDAWEVFFLDGHAGSPTYKTRWIHARCVRAGLNESFAPLVAGPYVVDDSGTSDVMDDTVLDQGTGLEWQRSASVYGDYYTWEEAIDYCESLDLGGHTDWRLPNAWELISVVDYDHYYPAIDATVFQFFNRAPNWSSTSSAGNPISDAWTVWLFTNGASYPELGGPKQEKNGAVCVRAGHKPLIVSSIEPAIGSVDGGISVIKGSGFGDTQGGGSVTFDGLAATVTSWSDTQIVVTTPAHAAGAVDVVVAPGNGKTATVSGGFAFSVPYSNVYLPAIKDGPHTDGLWMNFISIQAKDPLQQANVTFYLFNSDGSLRLAVTDQTPVNGGLVKTPNWLLHNALDVEQFDGTVIVSSDKPILGMTNTISPAEQGYDTYESPAPRASLFFPAAYDNYVTSTRTGYQNIIHLQNINPDPVAITVQYKDDYAGTVTDNYTIPGYGEYERNVRTVFGAGFNGTISVAANGNLAGMLRYEYLANNVVKSTTLYEATVDRTDIYYPYLYDGFSGNYNFYAIMNTSIAPVTCTLNFYENAGDTGSGPAFTDGPIIIDPGQRYTTTPSWARYGDLTHSFTGSIAGSCTGPVTSIINVITPNSEGYNDYEATLPKPALVFPQVYDNVGGYINELHLQNTNAFPVTVNMDLYFTTGELLGSATQVIGPHAKHVVRPYILNQDVATYQTNGSLKVAVDGGNQISGVMVFKKNTPNFISIYEAVSP